MKAIRKFEEFVKDNTVKRQSPAKPRANFLIIESQRSYTHLEEMQKKITLTDENANMFIKQCYDILMEIIRAKMLLDGYNATGFGAHEAEVAYLRNLKFTEQEVQFTDQLRYFRNGMLYYGTQLDKEYAQKAIAFTQRIYPKLKSLIKPI